MSYGDPPAESAPVAASASADRPALNLQLGGINVSVGGSTPGVYRSTSEGVSVQAEGLKDVQQGVKDLWGKMRQGVDTLTSR